MGTVGEEDRLQTTVIGDVVNTCSRVEDLTKIYKTPLLITQNTMNQLENPSEFHIRSIGMPYIRGKEEQLELFEVLDAFPEPLRGQKIATLKIFDQAMKQYNLGCFSKAKDLFTECLRICPEDEASKVYIDLIEINIKAQRLSEIQKSSSSNKFKNIRGRSRAE
jgi:hypothetical protein